MEIEIDKELSEKLGELEAYISRFNLGLDLGIPVTRHTVQYNSRTKKTTVKLQITWKSLTKKEQAATKKLRALRDKLTS